MIYNNIYETIGKTPIVKYSDNLFAKLEFFNPGGSVKDRIAFSMINALVKEGKITETTTIVEPTSGNTGIGIAMICASLGIKSIFTMPSSMSIERQKILKAYGATLILTEPAQGMSGAISKAKELALLENHILLSQFENEFNPLAHFENTALEILNDFPDIDILVSGIGTGGTITGIGRKLKDLKPMVKIIGVEPKDSPFLSQGIKGPHKIQGIGAGFKPDILDLDVIDELKTVSSDDAIFFAKKSAKEHGIMLGFSGGSAYKVALDISNSTDKKILFIVPDNGERYISTELYED